MKRIPTFVWQGKLLLGGEAIVRFEAQGPRCACGCGPAGGRIAGTCADMPAEWFECGNCTGTAIGQPLVYRIQSQIAAKDAELSRTTVRRTKQ